ncbi:MAG: hypothetical protein BWX85_00330 [Chloroflexi bacterium ADurb.Bin120]|nr:MAG: hypothetical protein BWX85_00330 [Chloroflexi bacterium ADurb.Bin120]
MQSTRSQWSTGAMECASVSPIAGSTVHSTNPAGMERHAEPEPKRASAESSLSESVKPSAAVPARARAAKPEAEEASPAPMGKLFSLLMWAYSFFAANLRMRSIKVWTRSNPLPKTG